MKDIPVPRVRLNPLHELARFLQKDKFKKKAQPKRIGCVRRIKLSYSDKHRQLVVFLRYGSLTDFSELKLRWCDISRRTGLGASTCRQMVYQFHKRGNTVKR